MFKNRTDVEKEQEKRNESKANELHNKQSNELTLNEIRARIVELKAAINSNNQASANGAISAIESQFTKL